MADSAEVTRVRLTTEGIEDVISALKKVQGEVGKTAKAGKDAGDALGALGTIFAATRLAAFAAAAIDTADGLGKMAQKTGVAVEQLSALAWMAQKTDVANQDLEKGLVKLAKSLEALQKGDATATEAFHQLGLSAKDLKGLSLDQVLLKVANAQAQFADGSGKTATMLAILGKSGANMIPLLNDLANGGFEAATQKLRDLGLVLSTDMAKKSQEFNDSMKRMEMAAQGATIQIAQSFLPSLTKGMDALTAALAGTPAGIKAFVGGTLLIGTASTATLVAVRALQGALASLGPVGIAVVALSTLVSGYMALKAAAEAAQAQRVKEAQDEYERVKSGKDLVDQYRKEAEALTRGGLSASATAEHQARLKTLQGELVKLGPGYKDVLDQQNLSLRDQASALRAVNDQQSERIRTQRAELQAQMEAEEMDFRKRFAKDTHQAFQAREQQAGMTGELPAGTEEAIRRANQKLLEEGLAQIRSKYQPQIDALGGVLPGAAAGGTKPPVPTRDTAGMKAAAAQALAEAKRQAEDVRQANEAIAKDYEDLYAHGLVDLETYYQARKALIKADTENEVRLLQAQIQAEAATEAAAATPAERASSETRQYELRTQLLAKQAAGAAKLRDLDRQERDDREKAGQNALKLEAELADAKGRTGEEAIRAIQAEIDKRKEAAHTQQERDLLDQLAAARINRSRLDAHAQALDRGQTNLDTNLALVDAERGQGLFGDDDALRRKADLYRKMLDNLEAIAEEQLRIARASDNPDDLLKAEQAVVSVEHLKASLHDLDQQIDWVGTTARDAFQSGLTDLLASLTDQTTTLTEKMNAFGRAVAQAMLQAAAAKAAAGITGALFGFAGGGAVRGPGTTTSDSILARLSNREFVTRAAAVDYYGEGLFQALNGLRLPKAILPGYAQGGLVGTTPAGASAVGLAGGAPAGVQVGTISIQVSAATAQGQAASDTPQGLALAKLIKGAVLEVLRNESRTNGALYRRR